MGVRFEGAPLNTAASVAPITKGPTSGAVKTPRKSHTWTAKGRHADFRRRPPKGTSLSLRLAPSAGNPLADTVSEYEASDQSDWNFQHEFAPTSCRDS